MFTNREFAINSCTERLYVKFADVLNLINEDKKPKYGNNEFFVKRVGDIYELKHLNTGLKSKFDKYGNKKEPRKLPKNRMNEKIGVYWVKRLDTNILNNDVMIDGMKIEINEKIPEIA